MRIITWNINSVRLRIELVEKLIAEEKPDVLCLQETKSPDDKFPAEAIAAAGLPHQVIRGMKGYNGVAVLSHLPLTETDSRDWVGREDCRHIAAMVDNTLEIHNFYVPAGGDEPDPEANDKFDHKLRFVDEMTSWFGENRKKSAPMVLVGDLNIAPLENDVWSHKQLLKIVSHTPVETEKLGATFAGLDWIDAVRAQIPEPEKLFSWWSYRARDWSAADKGRRLDHIWVTPPLGPAIKGARVLRDARGWERPSDHAPVIVDLDV